jgi:SAM-dependent methyltransferase
MGSFARKLLSTTYKALLKIAIYIPFTTSNILYRSLDRSAKTVLDIGCGRGVPAHLVLRRRPPYYLVGLDIFEPYVRECQKRGTHEALILGDARRLPFSRSKPFDIVFLLEVIEHLDKQEAKQVLEAAEEICRKQIIVTTPVGFVKQQAYDDNLYQEHKSAWSPAEFKRMGYKVRGVGIREVWGRGEEGGCSFIPAAYRPLLVSLIQVLVGPLVYFLPQIAGGMVAVKRIGG